MIKKATMKTKIVGRLKINAKKKKILQTTSIILARSADKRNITPFINK